MARRRRTSLIDDFIRLTAVLLFIGVSSFVTFWKSLSSQAQILFIALVSALLITGIILIIVWTRYRRHKREIAWKRAMTVWDQSRREDRAIHDQSARYLSPGHLEKFAAQLFKKMGYQAKHTGQTGDHGIDVRLINLKGQVEVVQCKQLNRPVGEEVVRELLGVMKHEKAVRGFLFAPGGFTKEARRWAKGEPIVLADEKEINHLVDSAYGQEM